MQVAKEKTANIVASANSGMEKAKAIAGETVIYIYKYIYEYIFWASNLVNLLMMIDHGSG